MSWKRFAPFILAAAVLAAVAAAASFSGPARDFSPYAPEARTVRAL